MKHNKKWEKIEENLVLCGENLAKTERKYAFTIK